MKKAKAMSIFAAALLASSMAVSVNAADYAEDPGYTLPETGYKTGTTGETPAPASSSTGTSSTAKAVTTVSTKSVEKAIANGTTITASYTKAAVKASAMAALAKSEDATLKISTKRYGIEIASSSVTEAKDVDFGIKITKNSKKGALILRTNQTDSYGCTVKLSLPAKVYDQAGVDIENAAIYQIVDGKAVKVADVEVDEDGNIVFEITDGGTYVIL